jgi:CRP-like cAMP-binding protein
MGVRADAETLSRIPIFSQCEAVPLQVLAFAAERERFARGQAIITENGNASSAYFILEGTAIVKRGQEVIGRAEPGSLLGETAMLGSFRYAVGATAETEVMAARIDTGLFQRVAGEYPEFGQAVLQVLSSRLSSSVKELEEVRSKLAKARSFSSL